MGNLTCRETTSGDERSMRRTGRAEAGVDSGDLLDGPDGDALGALDIGRITEGEDLAGGTTMDHVCERTGCAFGLNNVEDEIAGEQTSASRRFDCSDGVGIQLQLKLKRWWASHLLSATVVRA